MNNAEKIKSLAEDFAIAHNHYMTENGEHEEEELCNLDKARHALHAAIDEMQAEIDRPTATLVLQQSSYERELDIERVAKWAEASKAKPATTLLTNEELERICSDIYIFLRCTKSSFDEIARAIEAAVLKKNGIGNC